MGFEDANDRPRSAHMVALCPKIPSVFGMGFDNPPFQLTGAALDQCRVKLGLHSRNSLSSHLSLSDAVEETWEGIHADSSTKVFEEGRPRHPWCLLLIMVGTLFRWSLMNLYTSQLIPSSPTIRHPSKPDLFDHSPLLRRCICARQQRGDLIPTLSWHTQSLVKPSEQAHLCSSFHRYTTLP